MTLWLSRERLSLDRAERCAAERGAVERDVVERDVAERGAAERDVVERDVVERDVAERDVVERDVAERDVAERGAAERGVAERGAAERGVAERAGVIPLFRSFVPLCLGVTKCSSITRKHQGTRRMSARDESCSRALLPRLGLPRWGQASGAVCLGTDSGRTPRSHAIRASRQNGPAVRRPIPHE